MSSNPYVSFLEGPNGPQLILCGVYLYLVHPLGAQYSERDDRFFKYGNSNHVHYIPKISLSPSFQGRQRVEPIFFLGRGILSKLVRFESQYSGP